MSYPEWVVETNKINEVLFCEEFLDSHPMVSVSGSFFSVDGKIHDETRLRKIIYDEIKPYVTSGISKKVSNLLDVLRMECCTDGLPLHEDRIHVANGTLFLDGTFSPGKDFCRNRLPVSYNPEAAVSKIESHHERTKEKYASNPDIDPERKNLNFHLIEPADRYNAIISQQVKESGCRTRKDSVWMLEAFFTASPEFFKGRKNGRSGNSSRNVSNSSKSTSPGKPSSPPWCIWTRKRPTCTCPSSR